MAHWIATACAEAGGNRDECLRSVYDAGVGMSNWQKPIAGLGYEDMETSKYVQVAYAFRDGLTVHADAACAWKMALRTEKHPHPPTKTLRAASRASGLLGSALCPARFGRRGQT
jgi:hypothetical protein